MDEDDDMERRRSVPRFMNQVRPERYSPENERPQTAPVSPNTDYNFKQKRVSFDVFCNQISTIYQHELSYSESEGDEDQHRNDSLPEPVYIITHFHHMVESYSVTV